jgi:signal transduction histidine kinase
MPAPAYALNQHGLVEALRQLIGYELQSAFDEVQWLIDPAVEQRLPTLPASSLQTLFYAAREALRNAARHARHSNDFAPLRLKICLSQGAGDSLVLVIEDNGIGFNSAAALEGHGLALHSAMMAIAGGSLAVDGSSGDGTRLALQLSFPPASA